MAAKNVGMVLVGSLPVWGKVVDAQTRCVHYHTPLDILAIKFRCCDKYYPCYSCHEETADHPAQVWSKSQRHVKALLCGVCGSEHKIEMYLIDPSKCSTCGAAFNPRCELHHYLYFEM